MSQVYLMSGITINGKLELDEQEMRALDALVGYGTKAFLEVFYEKLGKAYLQPHEAGLKRLFENIRENIPERLRIVDDAKRALEEKLRAEAKRREAAPVVGRT